MKRQYLAFEPEASEVWVSPDPDPKFIDMRSFLQNGPADNQDGHEGPKEKPRKPHRTIPHSVACEKCGEMATVVRSRSRQGEQLVIARIEGKFYITIDCPNCGKVQQEIETPPGLLTSAAGLFHAR
jgi:ssDNA-binding Zn-finger/Zn-ribbon topoisomerase 1